jgi:hypothetical protein
VKPPRREDGEGVRQPQGEAKRVKRVKQRSREAEKQRSREAEKRMTAANEASRSLAGLDKVRQKSEKRCGGDLRSPRDEDS